MRRFRLRRKRIAAAALLPLAALFTTTALAAESAPESSNARIDASQGSVSLGETVTLRGGFPGAANAPIEMLLPASGHPGLGGRRPGQDRRRRAATRFASSRVEAVPGAPSSQPRLSLRPRPPRASRPRCPPSRSTATRAPSAITVRSKTSVRIKGRDALVGRTVEGSRQGDAGRRQAPRRRRHRRQADRDACRPRRALQRQLEDAEHRQLPGRGQGAHEPIRHRQPRVGRRDHGLSPGLASWYGPGLYGNTLACGGTLTPIDDRRRAQDDAVRHQAPPALRQQGGHRPRRRPRPLRRAAASST